MKRTNQGGHILGIMNTANDGQCFCSKSELELFATPPVNVSMERGDFAIHRTLSTITETSPLEFFVPGSPEEYIDLGRTRLAIKLQILKTDKTAIPDDAKVSTCNLLLHSLFSQVDCKLNQKLISPSVNTYPYKAYLETILAHGIDSKKTWLSAEMYYEDKGNLATSDPTATTNAGLTARNKRIQKSRLCGVDREAPC